MYKYFLSQRKLKAIRKIHKARKRILLDFSANAHDACGQCPDTFYVVGTIGQHFEFSRHYEPVK